MNILFLCTGNSARSILGEVICNDLIADNGKAYSAGSNPIGEINPAALKTLQKHGHETSELYSKHINEFTKPESPIIDLVISVCDNAANDCPIWLGNGAPERLHWPMPDPASIEDDNERTDAFENTYKTLQDKIRSYIKLSHG